MAKHVRVDVLSRSPASDLGQDGGPPGASDASSDVLSVSISRERIRLVLLLGVLVLAVVDLLGLIARFQLDYANLYGMIDLFHFDGGANVPAHYATLLLLAFCMTVSLIAARKRSERDSFTRRWIGLAFILLYMCVDEGAQFH